MTLATSQLRTEFSGRVIEPDDADFDSLRMVFNPAIDLRPAVILRPADAADVSRAVAFARESGLPLAVRSGGHNAAGYGTCEGGIVIDLRDMRALDIDLEARTVWAETGLTAADYTAALGEHGLATGFGDTGSVGIGGITVGGGVGFLGRKFGLTIDDLLAADVVTADGQLLRVDADNHPDLFWAIRGGGGNFGIATRFHFRAHEVGEFVGGMIFLPATPAVVASFIALAEAAPDELSTIANVMSCPPMPFIPDEHHGSIVVFAQMAYAGDVAEGERVLAPFRALATPLADMLEPMPYHGMYPPEEEEYRPQAVARTMFIDGVDESVAQTIIDTLAAYDASMRVVQLRVLGGAIARVPADATAFAHRTSRIMVNVAAFYDGPDDKAARESWVVDFAAALLQEDCGAYVNFVGDEGEERIRAAYPAPTYDRLAQIKALYDPTNLFRLNANIPPATSASL